MANVDDIRKLITDAAKIPDIESRIAEQRRLADQYPHTAALWFNLASDLALTGRAEECRVAVLRALNLDPVLGAHLPEAVRAVLVASQPTIKPGAITQVPDIPMGDQRGWNRENLNGRVLSKWRLGRLLGEGGFGRVFEAEHVEIAGHRAAVKILRLEAAARLEYQQRFINEMSIASRTRHENVVQLFDGGITDEGVCYAAMELLQGETLTGLLSRGPLPLPRVLHIARQIASALSAVHKLNVVHRDLKPDNIFITPRSSDAEFVKILDFGIAKLRDPGPSQVSTAGVTIGTPGYMAPEQWRMEPDIDGRADVYALGVILYQCLAGRLPFLGRSTFELQQAHLHHEAPSLPPSGEIPEEMAALIRAMLAKARDERPADMETVAERLTRIGRSLARVGPEVIERPPEPAPVSRRSLWPVAVGGVVILAGVALVVGRSETSTGGGRADLAPPGEHVPLSEAGAEQAFRTANANWNSGLYDAYFTIYQDPIDCFYNLRQYPVDTFRSKAVPEPGAPQSPLRIDRLVPIRSSVSEVYFWDIGHRKTAADRYRRVVWMRLIDSRWRVVGVVDRESHHCLPEIEGFPDP